MRFAKFIRKYAVGALALVISSALLNVASPRSVPAQATEQPNVSTTSDQPYVDEARLTITVKQGSKTTTRTSVVGSSLTGFNTMSITNGGTPSHHGCKTVTFKYRYGRTYYYVFGSFFITFFVFNLEIHWCYNHQYYDIVHKREDMWDIHKQAYFSSVDASWAPQGSPQYFSYWYQYFPPYTRSGYYTRAQQQIQNCVLKYGCVSTRSPWIKAWIHSDGTYSYDAGK